jgi:hypothetical protein
MPKFGNFRSPIIKRATKPSEKTKFIFKFFRRDNFYQNKAAFMVTSEEKTTSEAKKGRKLPF